MIRTEEIKEKLLLVGVSAQDGDDTEDSLEELAVAGYTYEILFLDAEDAVLVKRYKETRRSHPLAHGEL